MDQASALMIRFVIGELRSRDPALVPDGVETPDGLRAPRADDDIKRHILEHALKQGGPEIIIEIGQGIKKFAAAPIIHVLVNSRSPNVLIEKWLRFERYGHSKNRCRISEENGGGFNFQRYAATGSPPSTVENLLICGFLIALLECCGCKDVRCRLGGAGGTAREIFRNGKVMHMTRAMLKRTDQWVIDWQEFDGSRFEAGGDRAADFPALLREELDSAPPLIKNASRLISEDLSRHWSVGELAAELGSSARSLQRRFAGVGLNFSTLVRAARIQESSRMLGNTEISVTEIGYCCGFTDSAHFSRDFTAGIGMSPSAYRDYA
jgi:AraC-like DNA-binding protein